MSLEEDGEIHFDLLDGFAESGTYILDRKPEHPIPLIANYERSIHENAPVVVITHGYRGDPNGCNNVELNKRARALGFSTIRISHAGFDHYGHKDAPESVDTGTLVSNVEDVKHVLDAIDPNQRIISIASSGSLNVAYAVGRNDERVSHIIGVVPFPNMYDFINAAKKQGQSDLETQGYHIARRFGPQCKITQAWLDAGNPVSMSHRVGILLSPHQPKIITVRAEKDSTVIPHKLPFMKDFLNAFEDLGHSVDDYVTNEKTHEVTPAILRGVTLKLRAVADDLDFEVIANQPQQASELQTEHRHPG